MKVKSLLLSCCLLFSQAALAADNHSHIHKGAANAQNQAPNTQKPGNNTQGFSYCQITIINDSFDDINVYGRFDDGTYMAPFTIPEWDAPHYISLYYYGYCHGGMDLYVDTVYGKHKYQGFTPVNKTIRIKNF